MVVARVEDRLEEPPRVASGVVVRVSRGQFADDHALNQAAARQQGRPGTRLERVQERSEDAAPMYGMEWRPALEEFERGYLVALMRAVDGNLSEAERWSGISRKSLRARLRRLGLRE